MMFLLNSIGSGSVHCRLILRQVAYLASLVLMGAARLLLRGL